MIMKEVIKTLIPEDKLLERVKEIGNQLNEEYKDKEVVVVGVLKGSVIFMADLVRFMNMSVQLDFMDVSSYGDNTVSSGQLKINKDLENSISDKHVILIEDIVDSGRTLKHLIAYLKGKSPASIKLVTLLDKPERRLFDVKADIVGFDIPDEFVVGYGLDYAQKYRNLPYIGVLEFIDE